MFVLKANTDLKVNVERGTDMSIIKSIHSGKFLWCPNNKKVEIHLSLSFY